MTGVALLSCSALAQNSRSGLIPITSPIRDAGTLDWSTGTWHRQGGAQANGTGFNVIYDNRCTWTGGAFYIGNANCWQQYEEARLPTTDAADPFLQTAGLAAAQLCDCYFLSSFQFGYCTDEITPGQGGSGNVQIQIGFIEGPNVSGIGGDCMNAALTIGSTNPPSGGALGFPPANFGGPNDLFADIQGLPGTNQVAPTACWTVTIDLSNNANGGFEFCGNGGDVTFDNDGTDYFNILYGLQGTTELGAAATGFFQAAEPLKAAPGAGAFGLPTVNDPNTGNSPCGTGLDAEDRSWINVDNNPVGTPNTAACPATTTANGPLPGGSNCYILGTGWPAAPFADVFMLMTSSTTCASTSGADWMTYCTAKASSSGCLASLSGSGNTLVSGANNFTVTMSGAQGQRPGIFIGGKSAPSAIAFFGGTLCVQPPLKRGLIKFTGGVANTCTGSYNQLINNGNSFPPGGTGFDSGAGTTSWMQGWYRDPALMSPQGPSFDIALSNGIELDWN